MAVVKKRWGFPEKSVDHFTEMTEGMVENTDMVRDDIRSAERGWKERQRRDFTHPPAVQTRRTLWWADSVECFGHLRNVQDLLADPCELRFGEPFKKAL